VPGLVDSHRLRVETALIDNVNNIALMTQSIPNLGLALGGLFRNPIQTFFGTR
jgi:hypothetical protein